MLFLLPVFGHASAAQDRLPAHEQVVSATVLPASAMHPEIAVFYLGIGRPESLEWDGVRMLLGWELPEVPPTHRKRLVVLSHGSDGNPWQHSDLAKQLVLAGFVVAAPFHVGDNTRDHDHSTLTTWTNWNKDPSM